ncbi:Uncharacterized protein Adt_00220 [Abeliophyllum distichum]|uniref:ATP synthase F0 subunit 8 n=1 Tax=Abeliophyllum distichum TaxID=126358 RepID=A0ABD1VPS6_9LAMI
MFLFLICILRGSERESKTWLQGSGGYGLFSIICYFVQRKLRLKGEEKAKKRALLNELEDTRTPPGKYSKSSHKIDKNMRAKFTFSALTALQWPQTISPLQISSEGWALDQFISGYMSPEYAIRGIVSTKTGMGTLNGRKSSRDNGFKTG